jgi:serine/threonine protein kinase/Tol biopolymer transport system component
MALTAGTKLGPYEIQSSLGAGGMGEVYRARDTRLERTVAIKILPLHLSDNPEARQRLEREARTISSLNHPNICVLHDVGSQDGTSYLVMEYVRGESLESRLQKGPLPLKQALECGVQICDALEKAHRAGIVHRDLKPGNIMLTASGAKLLDFGLAKPAVGLLGAQALSDKGHLTPSTPTMNLSALGGPQGSLTQQGTIVGTFQFMAPEVLQGQEADARSDIFSFGCVLYQMITGRRAFEGKSQISVASAILEKEPEPITKIQPLAPAALDHVVHECLAKDPESRWQNAADIGRELRWIASSGSSISPAPPVSPRRRLLGHVLWVAVVAALVAVLVWTNLWEREPARTLRSFLIPPAETGFDFTGDFSGPPAITADGTAVAFCARSQKEKDSIWVQSLSDLTAKKLEGTEGASFPFWSADGRFVGFFADGHLKKVLASGGPVTVLAEAPNPRGGSWNQDNVILYEPDYRDSLWRISAAGGTPVRLTKLEAGKHTTHRWPRFLPDGKHFLFFATNHSGGSEQGIYFGSLQDGSYKRVLDADSDAQYASGYLLYHLQSALLAQKFDLAAGAVSGDPVPVADLVEYDVGTWHTTFTASQNGLLIYEPGSKTLGTDLFWLDRSGKTLGKVAERAFYKGSGQLSPDGKRLAISMGDPQADIWVFDLARGSRTRLTFGGATHLMPSWSADGQRVVYTRQSGATVTTGTSLCARLANGGGQEEVLMEGDHSSPPLSLLSPQWSHDGRYLLHMEQSGPSGAGVWALPTTGEKKPFAIVQPPSPQARIVQFRLSPDGRWLAYSSTASGREEVYVTHFPSGAGRWQVSQTGGTFPAWRGDSKEIYFTGQDGSFNAASVNMKSEEFELDQVRALFQMSYTSPLGTPYDVTPDGQRFVFATYPESVSTPLVLVTNWTADLKK